MLSEQRIGHIKTHVGSTEALRGDNTGAIVVTQAHAVNAEAVLGRATFIVSTAVGGVAPGTALSTTPPLVLLNPLNSGKTLIVISTSLGYVSGTLGAGSIVYAHYTPQATIPSGGTELTPIRTYIAPVRGIGRVFQGSTLSGTPVILRPAYMMGAALASTALGISIAKDLVDGAICVPSATAFVMQGIAASGSTPLVLMSITWEEIDE